MDGEALLCSVMQVSVTPVLTVQLFTNPDIS